MVGVYSFERGASLVEPVRVGGYVTRDSFQRSV